MSEEKNVYEAAVSARAEVERLKVLVDAAYAAWEQAFKNADPGGDQVCYRRDPEVEWDSPASESEALLYLMVARLGGELAEARIALGEATRRAQTATRAAMERSAYEGRVAWRSRHFP